MVVSEYLEEEKEREGAALACEQWSQLNESQYLEIAHKLLSDIEPALRESMKVALNTTVPREVEINEVVVTIGINLGESRQHVFDSVSAAIEFLEAYDDLPDKF